MALSFAQPQVERPGPVGAPPCRSLQPLRSGQPAARVGPFQLSSPVPASTRKKVVATASRRKTTASNNLDPLSRATVVRPPPLLREYRRARSTNRAGQPSEPFFMGMGQGLYALDLRPWRPQARRRRERVAGAYADRRQQCLGAAGP